MKISQTPSPKKDRIYGSKKNKPKSSESSSKGASIVLSPKTISSIKSKIDIHNDKFPKNKIPLSTAKAVVRRGMGAYSSSHRPTIRGGKPNSRVAWGLARLNAFIYKIQKGYSKSGKYSQDNDLIKELGYEVSKYKEGGEASWSKMIGASSRFKPRETIFFNPPLLGLNGSKLVSYTWAYEMTMQPNWEGEMVGKRVSDWTQAETSADTGRDIVHKYTIELSDGSLKTVSSESVPILLGYIDKSQSKIFGNLATASKTLAKQQMKLSILEAQQKELEEAKKSIIDKGFPEPRVEKVESISGYKLYVGDGSCYIDEDGTYDEERLKCAKDNYIRNRLLELGFDPYKSYNSSISDLKPRIERQKRKVEDMLKSQNMKDGGEIDKNNQDNIDDFDYMSLYNPTPEEEKSREEEYKKSLDAEKEKWYQANFSKKYAPNYKSAINRAIKEYIDAKLTFEDWASRIYKSNKKNIFLGDDDVFGESKSIGSINEARRKRVLRAAKMRMDESIETLKYLGLQDKEIDELLKSNKNFEDLKLFKQGGDISESISSEEVELILGRKLNMFYDNIVYINGKYYEKLFLKAEYQIIK